jgi:hypothetical protein
MAEDIGSLEARIRAASRRVGGCGICEWLEQRPPEEQAVWDRVMALPVKEANHTAIRDELRTHGLTISDSTVGHHRKSGHRRGPD